MYYCSCTFTLSLQVQLQDKISKMNEELEVYSDTDKLKKSLEEKRKLLIAEREKILGTRDASKANLEKLQAEVGTENYILPYQSFRFLI